MTGNVFRTLRTRAQLNRLATAALVAVLAAGWLLVGPAGSPAAAPAPPLLGNDISWPQCPVGVGSPRPGQGQPMPPDTARFLIIGLTDGVGFVANPCLTSQLAWARAHHTYTAAYANSGYPTAAEIATYGDDGPWTGTDALSRLRNTGYAEAWFNVVTMRRAGFFTPHVWIDVEPNRFKPWSTSFASNKAVIDGTLRGYADRGYSVGFYSVPSLWEEVLGPGVAYRLPEWRTAGGRGYDEALSRCTTPSFNGGPAVLAQWWIPTMLFDLLCPAYNSAASLARFFWRPTTPIPLGDYDGDGRTDHAVWRPSTGGWHVPGMPAVTWGRVGDLPVPGDYNGDGRSDLAVWRQATGFWYVRGGVAQEWGVSTDRPVTGDFTGNGRTDLAVYRPSTQAWWVRGRPPVRWGLPGDIPTPGDYNGDGRTDIAVWRPRNGTWYIYGGPAIQWGLSGDWQVAADYNGDGRTDLAVYRRSTQTWWVRGQSPVRWGLPGDLPVPGEYFGGRSEIAMYRPTTGVWHMPFRDAVTWGLPGDIPVRRQPVP